MYRRLNIEVNVNGNWISCLYHKGGKEAIVFIHGFGASKETFLEAFEREELRSFTILSSDLVGFGDSDKPGSFSYQMEAQAEILKKIIDRFRIDQFHIVAHSMGGIIGIQLSEMLPDRARSLINVEGNLTVEDCTMTGQVAEMGEGQFEVEGLQQLKDSIVKEAERNQDEALQDYLKSLSKATAQSLYKSAISTVHQSTHGNLPTRFERIQVYKCYIYGEKNKGNFPAEKILKQKGIPVFYISKSGHSMMKENSDEFYSVISRIISKHA